MAVREKKCFLLNWGRIKRLPWENGTKQLQGVVEFGNLGFGKLFIKARFYVINSQADLREGF